MNRGFTLIEILISIAIMTIISVVALPNIRHEEQKSEDITGGHAIFLINDLRDTQNRSLSGALLTPTGEVPLGYQLRIVNAHQHVIEAVFPTQTEVVFTRDEPGVALDQVGWRFYVPVYESGWQFYDATDQPVTTDVVQVEVTGADITFIVKIHRTSGQISWEVPYGG